MNPKLTIKGILITIVDYRTNFAKVIRGIVYSVYGQNVHIFEHGIHMSVRASESSAEWVSIFVYDPIGKVAEAYEELTKEVLS